SRRKAASVGEDHGPHDRCQREEDHDDPTGDLPDPWKAPLAPHLAVERPGATLERSPFELVPDDLSPCGNLGSERPSAHATVSPIPDVPAMACHTRSGVSGMSTWRTPRWRNASTTAFCTAGGPPMVPDSAMPLNPKGLLGDGVSVSVHSNDGMSAAVGRP